MVHSLFTYLAFVIVVSGSLTAGRMLQQHDLESQSERTAQAIVDAHDVINAALANADARPASTKSLVYARQATRATTEPWLIDGSTGARKLLQRLFSSPQDSSSKSPSEAVSVNTAATAPATTGRKLQRDSNDRGDRVSWALSATQDVIAKAVASGASLASTRYATRAGLYNARLTTRDSGSLPWQFDSGDRK
jgi:hypothetical protein